MDYGSNGYVSYAPSDFRGNFEPFHKITLNFPQSFPVVIPGITITWSETYNEWATKFRVTAYHGEMIVFVRDVENNDSVKSIVSGNISGYDKIIIEVFKWSVPEHRLRLEDIFLGVEKTYTKADIVNFNASMFVDPLSAELPKAEISFVLKNLDGEFNPNKAKSTGQYLMERQEVEVRYGYRFRGVMEWIPGGTYYLSEWDTPQNGITASFTARDSLEFMSDPYNGVTSGTLYDIATAAFQQAVLPAISGVESRWIIDNSLKKIRMPSNVDMSKFSIAEVLQCCANASCCVFYQDRSGVLRIEPLVSELTDYRISRFNSYENAAIKLSKQLKAININDGQYQLAIGIKGESQPVENPFIPETQAPYVAKWVAERLQDRRTLSGSFRADPRLDPLDFVRNESLLSTAQALITTVNYSYNGAFRGSYEGRGLENSLSIYLHSGEKLAVSLPRDFFPTAGG